MSGAGRVQNVRSIRQLGGILALLLTVCVALGDPPPEKPETPPAQPTTCERYFPLREGASWTYRLKDVAAGSTVEYRYQVWSRKPVGKGECVELRVRYGKTTGYEYWAATSEGIFRYRNAQPGGQPGVDRIEPPVALLRAPVVPGQSWEWTETLRPEVAGSASSPGLERSQVQWRAVIESVDAPVKTPAGSYRAALARLTSQRVSAETREIRYWFAPDVGIVRREEGAPGKAPAYILELTAYTPPDPRQALAVDVAEATRRYLRTDRTWAKLGEPSGLEPIDLPGFLDAFRSRLVVVRWPRKTVIFRLFGSRILTLDPLRPGDWNGWIKDEQVAIPRFSTGAELAHFADAAALLIAAREGHPISQDTRITRTMLYDRIGRAQWIAHARGEDARGRPWLLRVGLTVRGGRVEAVEYEASPL